MKLLVIWGEARGIYKERERDSSDKFIESIEINVTEVGNFF